MSNSPDITPMVHIGNGHYISEAEARSKGLRPSPAPKPAPQPVHVTRSDRIFEAVLWAITIGLGSAFAAWLNVALWGR